MYTSYYSEMLLFLMSKLGEAKSPLLVFLRIGPVACLFSAVGIGCTFQNNKTVNF